MKTPFYTNARVQKLGCIDCMLLVQRGIQIMAGVHGKYMLSCDSSVLHTGQGSNQSIEIAHYK
jgi:hypothetical protein